MSIDPQHLTPAGVLQLQRTLGNRAVGNLLRRIEGTAPIAPQATTTLPMTIQGETSLTPFVLQDLKADFVANVAIIPIKERAWSTR